MASKRELRIVPVTKLEIREGSENQPPRLTGYAAVFNSWSDDLGGFRERIAPGAFAKTLQEADVRALQNHNPDYVLGRTKSGTLRLLEDDYGLGFEITPPDTTWARDLLATMERGDVDQMSFQFRTIKDVWEKGEELAERTLLEVALYDVSVVTFPAYPATEAVVARSWMSEKGFYLPEPPRDGHSDGEHTEPGQSPHSEIRRRRLALLERQVED